MTDTDEFLCGLNYMNSSKTIEWILRISVAGEFIGHGMFALQGKQAWIGWIQWVLGTDPIMSTQLLVAIGVLDIIVAFIVLLHPIRVVLLWAAFWGFWTALIRPIVGESFWDFIERWANWGAPLALLLFRGWPRSRNDWLR